MLFFCERSITALGEKGKERKKANGTRAPVNWNKKRDHVWDQYLRKWGIISSKERGKKQSQGKLLIEELKCSNVS